MTGPFAPPPPAPALSREHGRRGLGCLPTVAVAVLVMLAVAALAGVVAWRYLPLAGDVQEARQAAQRMAAQVRELEPADLERETIMALDADLGVLDDKLGSLRAALDDPLVEPAALVPSVTVQLDAASSLLDAAEKLVEAGDLGLELADRVVTMRETNDLDPGFQLTSGLVELVATSGDEVDRMDALIADAQRSLDEIPADAIGPIRAARDLVAEPLDTYRPLLEQYRELDDVVPGLMGWGGQKRYLVLAQNPAELRPAGGYTGTVGLITVEDGRLVEQRFQDVYELDLQGFDRQRQAELPFIEPPAELTEHLLAPNDDGTPQSWRLADATWSPDFPTGAETAARFYAIQADGVEVDGVIAVTTFALDRLLDVVGPVDVPSYDLTVEPGDVTLTLLGATRGAPGELQGRKDVLDALARTLTQRLLALPPDQWAPMVSALEGIVAERDVMVWLADPDAQELVLERGWGGPVRTDTSDYVYVVESNVAPTSKYNLVVDRSDSLLVNLDASGDSLNSLRLDWQNRAGEEGAVNEALRAASENKNGWYGTYMRVLVPQGSELVVANGESVVPVRDVERVTDEAGRLAFGNYLLMEPGESTLSYLWSVPEAAVETDAGWVYELVVQKQPGAPSSPLSVRIELPAGATVTEASDGLLVEGERVTYQADLATDAELRLVYRLPD